MKINFVHTANSSATETYVIYNHAAQLKAMGHELSLVSVPAPKVQKKSWLRRKQVRDTSTQALLSGHADTEILVQMLRDFRPIVDRDLPDAEVTIATCWESAEWVNALSPSKGTKAYLVQNLEPENPEHRRRAHHSFSLPLHKIAASEWLAQSLRLRYKDKSVEVVPNGIDLDALSTPLRGRQKKPTIGIAYSVEKSKACEVGFHAFVEATLRCHDLQLIAAGTKLPGQAPHPPKGTQFIEPPSLEHRKQLYRQCDVWIYSSRLEGFANCVLEAMACRTPIVATTTGGTPQLVADGGGLLVTIDDATDMANAINTILELPTAQWQAMSQAAYNSAQKYSWERTGVRLAQTLFKVRRSDENIPSPAVLKGPNMVGTMFSLPS